MDWQRNKSVLNLRRYAPKLYLFSIALVVLLIVVILVALVLSMKTKEKVAEAPLDRIECPGLKDEDCSNMLCNFEKVAKGPKCYMKKDAFGYRIKNFTEEEDGPNVLLRSDKFETPYGKSIPNVIFKVTYLTENIVRFQFKDADKKRYEVPAQDIFPLLQNTSEVDTKKLTYTVTFTKHSYKIFNFDISRKSDGTKLWDTSLGALLLSNQYLQIGSYLPSENIYGLGEHVHDSLVHNLDYVSWPLFSRDRAPHVPADQRNLYGVHPFYTCLENTTRSHGVLFLNSNAMEVTFMPAPAVSFRTIGGILDFFIFVGDNPEHVVQLYTSLVGRPMMPPYWALGFQLSRYGYNSLDELQSVVNRTRAAGIPQAVQYLDIDHMDENKDFTYDPVTFSGLPDYINEMKSEQDLKWIVILDPGIAVSEDYEPYKSGIEQSVFIKRAGFWNPAMFPRELENLNVSFGKVWPKTMVGFPDFFLNATKQWWKDQIVNYHSNISFDGLWIDMNEPANFAIDKYYPGYCPYDRVWNETCWGIVCEESLHEDPPYNPLKATGSERLSEKTLCMESIQGQANETEYLHYDVHSLYGWSQTQPTLEAAQEATGTRSLVISRSTYPSSGQHGGHWLGDNFSTFEDMKRSIIGMLEFNLFGIPYIGADVCGFNWDTTPDMCMRWMQLGAFYPYFRNHNGIGQMDQDPASFSNKTVVTASRKAVERRLGLNPYLYTLFYRAHVDGSTVVRPLFHEFPDDKQTWNISTEFMWGKSLLINPILDENRVSVNVYLPKDEWWLFKEEKSEQRVITQWYSLEPDADEYTPLYVRGGTVLPYEKYNNETGYESSNSTNLSLYIFPKDDEASGELFVDDGISKDTVENEEYATYEFTYSNCSLQIKSQEYSNFNETKELRLEKLVIFKVEAISNVTSDYKFTVDQTNKIAEITVDQPMKDVDEITWEDSSGGCKMAR